MIPDVTVGVVIDPPPSPSGGYLVAYAGACTIEQVAAGDPAQIDLSCTGDAGPAPLWSATITVAGLGRQLPAALSQDTPVDLSVFLANTNQQVTGFGLSVAGEVALGGVAGNLVDVEGLAGSNPGLWPGFVVTTPSDQACAKQSPIISCGPPVARNRIEFSAPDGHLEVFDHNSGSTPNFEFRVGDALAPVDDGTPWDCGGGGVAWYSFAIARRG
ncbi:MAG: hypothetical protein U0168_01830 [Nannocystaceae bacterium]